MTEERKTRKKRIKAQNEAAKIPKPLDKPPEPISPEEWNRHMRGFAMILFGIAELLGPPISLDREERKTLNEALDSLDEPEPEPKNEMLN